MYQLLQNLKDGETSIVEAPAPALNDNSVIIDTSVSLISMGTEKMLVNFGKSSYLNKARQQPEKVQMVFDKVKTDGLFPTFEAVKSKLDKPIPLGYSNVGIVREVGKNVLGISVGQRVLSNGPHADIVRVNKNLISLIPDDVDDDSAVFTVIASIGLQGVRLLKPTLGEKFVVFGVGLIGLLTVQLLKANGCQVLAIDLDSKKLKLAEKFGAKICDLSQNTDPVQSALNFSNGIGVDGVIITTSTNSDDPITQSAEMSRKQGRIILVGTAGLNLKRELFYEKELTFQVSCSYGPGRYDNSYEELGQDYPIAYVRWTEQRNFESVLEMISNNLINLKPLISERIEFEDAPQIYENLSTDKTKLGIILDYKKEKDVDLKRIVNIDSSNNIKINENKPVLGFIGAGNYASRTLIPLFKRLDTNLNTIVTSGGVNSTIQGKKFGFINASTDIDSILNNKLIDTAVVATRHDSNALYTKKLLLAGKNVFVEKPLAINLNELNALKKLYLELNKEEKKPQLMVGFNRRFAPHINKMKSLINNINEPKSIIMTMNAGYIPSNHWTHDNLLGGGRIIGEACHYIDLMRFLVGRKIISFNAEKMGKNKSINLTEDKTFIILNFEDGSHGVIIYLANGSNKFPKERIEIFTAGKILQLENFKKLRGFGWKGFNKLNLWKQDKGQINCISSFIDSIQSGLPLIPIDELFETSQITIEVANLLRK